MVLISILERQIRTTYYWYWWLSFNTLHRIGFQKFQIQAKQDVVIKHTLWIQTVVARVNRFREIIKSMTKFSQVEKFANNDQIQWKIDPEILADKFGMDLVISIDDAVESIMNIGKPKPTREEKILAEKANGIGLAS